MRTGEILELSAATRDALTKAERLLDRLTEAGCQKTLILGALVEPTSRIKQRLEAELAELERIATDAGL